MAISKDNGKAFVAGQFRPAIKTMAARMGIKANRALILYILVFGI